MGKKFVLLIGAEKLNRIQAMKDSHLDLIIEQVKLFITPGACAPLESRCNESHMGRFLFLHGKASVQVHWQSVISYKNSQIY
jgi:hypothetical protein